MKTITWKVGTDARGQDVVTDKIVMCNVHLHCHVANKKGTTKEYRKYFDALAEGIHETKARFLFGDFNMALLEMVVQLRMRGIMANMASCMFVYDTRVFQLETLENVPEEDWIGNPNYKLDSCGIISIGPVESVRWPWNSLVFGVKPWKIRDGTVDHKCRPMLKHGEYPYTPIFTPLTRGAGFNIHSYRPKDPQRKKEMLEL
ncbi:MAG: hypothetical protein VXZ84_10205, partial [Planctomycetota bacterium]|nr:hypothetical protein [Planctomycetota bacterium]